LALLPRRLRYALIGALLAVGAPGGLLTFRVLTAPRAPGPGALVAELMREPPLYLYLSLSTLVVFALFGYSLGRQADRLALLSNSDPLTGLLNARALSERLASECARAGRYHQPLSLLLVDVDGLKELNDRLGHTAGDAALTAAAQAVRTCSRAADVASRWGGDEFAVVAPNTDARAAARMADRIRMLAAHAPPQAPGAAVTVSVGVATWSPSSGHCGPERLKRAADAALYAAKRAGRNCVRALRCPDGAVAEKGLDAGRPGGPV